MKRGEKMEDYIKFLKDEMDKKEKRTVFSFEEFFEAAKERPEKFFRNIFQLFYDMIMSLVEEEEDADLNDLESVGFRKYNCSKLLVEDVDTPFYADKLFIHRFIKQVKSLKQGAQQNRIYIFEGPAGCGKSTFLNNILKKFEEYTNNIRDGQCFEIFWRIDSSNSKNNKDKTNDSQDFIEIPCPSHDHPLLIVPKQYRFEFLKKILGNKINQFKEKEYDWMFKEEACTICQSLFWSIFDKSKNFSDVLRAMKVRTFLPNRRIGNGITVWNPGDAPLKNGYLNDKEIQEKLDKVFGGNLVKYVFSPFAKTNNGIYVLMDIKGFNKDRLFELHNIISEGIHKVDVIEEKVNSLFFALMNPEDKKEVEGKEEYKSFLSRIQYIQIPYVLEPETEVKIYCSIFGDNIKENFLPQVLENFAKIIISSRMNTESAALKEWIPDFKKKYEKYCDEYGLLLRMEIYSGRFPLWLSEEDRKKFSVPLRKKMLTESKSEGNKGISGRDSIRMLEEFCSSKNDSKRLITMNDVVNFFKKEIGKETRNKYIPERFIDAVVNFYNFNVLNEVKEALYFYNESQLKKDILNYLYVINCKEGDKVICPYTNEELYVSKEFIRLISSYLSGQQLDDKQLFHYVMEIQQRYALTLLENPDPKNITETELYRELLDSYRKNIKENVLTPFENNENFKKAIEAWDTEEFDKIIDSKIKEVTDRMLKKLMKFGYKERAAKEVAYYCIEEELNKKYKKA